MTRDMYWHPEKNAVEVAAKKGKKNKERQEL